MKVSESIYLGNLQIESKHIRSGQIIKTDAPPDNNGKGEYFSPTDLVATALANCMLTVMGIAGNTHGFIMDGATASITKVMSPEPRRIAEIIIDFTFPLAYNEKQKRMIVAAAKACPVAKSLHPELKKTCTFRFTDEEVKF